MPSAEITIVRNAEGHRVPDICECFTADRKYRVTGWYRDVPLRPPTRDQFGTDIEFELFTEFFQEDHPSYLNEYHLVACSQEEATFVGGYSTCGGLFPISEIQLEDGYVPWPDELIESERKRFVSHLGQRVDHTYTRRTEVKK